MEAFSDRYYCVSVCLPGYCGIAGKQPRSFTTMDLAIDFASIIVLLQYRSAIIVAHDWGGMLAWTLASRFPSMVERLIIMNCPHPRLFIENVSIDQIIKSFYFLLFQLPYLPEIYIGSNGYDFIRRLVAFDRPIGSSFSNADIRIMQHHISQPGVLTNALNYYRYMFNATTADWAFYDKRIECPVLVLWGSNDAALRPDLNRNLSTVCPRSRLHVLQGSTHWISMDRPSEVNAEMRVFLNQK